MAAQPQFVIERVVEHSPDYPPEEVPRESHHIQQMQRFQQEQPIATGNEPVIQNRKARHSYTITATLECGITLTGTETKSVRAGQVCLAEGYVRAEDVPVSLVLHRDRFYESDSRVLIYGQFLDLASQRKPHPDTCRQGREIYGIRWISTTGFYHIFRLESFGTLNNLEHHFLTFTFS